jgi:Spy/CpxP family protein refolding chaperone
MKKLILSVMLFIGLSETGFSQERAQRVPKTPEERAQMMTDVLERKLSLTNDQKIQIYQVNLERAQAVDKMRKVQANADRSKMREQFKTSDEKIVSILDEKQRIAYTQLKAERREKMENHRGEHRGGDRNKKG